MGPRTFLAPIQCNLCSFLLYTRSDVSRHCSYHEKADFICHHCLTQFDSKGAIAAHMNQKGAHLRPSFDPRTYDSAMPSPASSTSAVLPLSQPAPPPAPAFSTYLPTSAVATSDSVSLDQLLRDIDIPSTGIDTSAVSSNISPPFQPQAASKQQHSFSSPDVSPTVGTRPTTSVSYPQGNTENYVNKIPNTNSCFGGVCTTSNHYLLYRRRRAVSLISLYAGCCSRRRLRRPSLTRTRPLRISSPNFMICTSKQLLNFHKSFSFPFIIIFLSLLFYFACVR